AAESAPGRPPVRLWMSAARLGDVAFLGLGCEAFNEIGREIKASSPFPVTIVITHCNGAAGYLPARHAYQEGGYQVESSPFAPGAAEQVVEESLRLLNAIK